jgi:hypothetical protein
MVAEKKRDIPATAPDESASFIHCKKCVEEIEFGGGGSPRDYSRLSVAFTEIGLQVWCDRHNINVMHIDFQGMKHPANLKPK